MASSSNNSISILSCNSTRSRIREPNGIGFGTVLRRFDNLIQSEEDGLLTTEEIAQKLKLSVERTRELVKNETIPCIRINSRTWRFHWPTVLAALQGKN